LNLSSLVGSVHCLSPCLKNRYHFIEHNHVIKEKSTHDNGKHKGHDKKHKKHKKQKKH